MTTADPDEQARLLAAEALRAGEPTGWFEPLYAGAEDDGPRVPWDRGAPQQRLVEWAIAHDLRGEGRRALVIGCAHGQESEYLAGRGFDVTAFDISPTVVRGTRERFPESTVHYRVADLLDPPTEWRQAFDFVFEAYTVQSMPPELHRRATDAVTATVAPGGTLLVVAVCGEGRTVDPPPWPLTRAELDAFAGDGLRPADIADVPASSPNGLPQWLAEFRRPSH